MKIHKQQTGNKFSKKPLYSPL